MKRRFFTRLLQRCRELLRGRPRKARPPAPSLRLQALEDRRLMAAGFGASSLFGRLAPVTIEITIQQPAVVSPSSVNLASSIQNSGQYSLLFASSEGFFLASAFNSSLASSTGLVNDLLTPVNATANNLVTPVNATANSPFTLLTSAVNTVTRATQPLVTTTTNVVSSTLPLVPNLLFVGTQTNPPPLPAASSFVAPVNVAVSVPNLIHTPSVVSPIANVGSSPVSVAIPPALPPSLDVPSAPVDSAPVVPPAQPDPAPPMPAVPAVQPVVPSPLDNAPTASTPIQMSVVAPAMTPEAPPIAPPTLDNPPPASFPVETSLAVPPVVPPPAVHATTDAPLAASNMAIAETAAVEPAKGPTLDFTTLRLNANATSANEVTPPQAGRETAAPLSGASDAVFTRLAQDTAQKMTLTAKEMLTPSNEHWMRYVAPIFIAAGVYVSTRLADRKKTDERRPVLQLAN